MTTKCTSQVNGGAMSKFDRKAIMARAWTVFRETYKYPAIKFSSIGWKCFGWALRKAWAEAREAARLTAMTEEAKVERVELLQVLISRTNYIDRGPMWRAAVTAYRDEIRQLHA